MAPQPNDNLPTSNTAESDQLDGNEQPERSPHEWWRWLLATFAVGGLAAGVRIIVLLETRQIGFLTNPVSDGAVYLRRAREITMGDWLGPAEFVHAPLYAYVLAALQIIGLGDAWLIRGAQIGMSVVTTIVLMDLGRRLLGSRCGVAAGLLFALLPAAIFFDLIVQKTSLAMLLSVSALWLLVHAADSPRLRWTTMAGAVLGLLILTRQNALAILPLAVGWLYLMPRELPRARRAALLVALLLGVAGALAPWVARNRVVLGEAILTTPNLGQNFAMGNHSHATGTYLPARRGWASGEREQSAWINAAERAEGRTLTAGEVSDHYLDAAIDWILANPIDWLALTAKKALLIINACELPDAEDYYLYRDRSIVLRSLDMVLHAGVVFPLAAVGLLLTWPKRRRLWLLYGWIFSFAAATIVFVVFARYRMPITLAALPLAAAAIVTAPRFIRTAAPRHIVGVSAVAVGVATLANLPIHTSRQAQPFSYVNHAIALAEADRFDDALRELRQALARAPDHVDAHWIRGTILMDLDRVDEAAGAFQRAIDGDANFAAAWRGLAAVHAQRGSHAEARAALEHARALDPDDPRTLDQLAVLEAERGDWETALSLLDRAVALDPRAASHQLNRGNVLLALHRLEEAETAYERARMLAPDSAEPLTNLAFLAAAKGRWAEAEGHFREALARQPGAPAARDGLIECLLRRDAVEAATTYLQSELDAGRGDDRLEALHRELKNRRPDASTSPPPD